MCYSSWIWHHVEKVGTLQKSKIISGKPLAYKILYKKENERGIKKPFLRALLSLSLEIDEDNIWFSK